MRLGKAIKGSSVHLELFLESDVSEKYLGWLSDYAINRFLETRFIQLDADSAKRYIEQCQESPDVLFLKIVTDAKEFIGTCTVFYNQFHRTAKIGLMIGEKSFQNRGIGSEVISLLKEFCCADLGVRKITAGLYSSNIGSMRAFLKNEFFLESTLKLQVLLDDEPEDVYQLAYFCSKY